MKTYSIALIGGDGIGPEILRVGKKVTDVAAEVAGITWRWKANAANVKVQLQLYEN